MGLNFGEKLNAAKQKMGDVKKSVGENMADFKQKNAENKAEREQAKAPVEGAIIRYLVVYKGGFPMKPQQKSASLSIGFNVLEDSFVFKPELLAKQQWFGEENLVVPYDRVIKLELAKRQVSTAEYMMSGNGNAQSLEQLNNINITYLNENDIETILRVEMLTGTTVFGQAQKCTELMDLLREKRIFDKFRGEKKEQANAGGGDDILTQIEKLATLKEKGFITEDEFNAKKTELLSKL